MVIFNLSIAIHHLNLYRKISDMACAFLRPVKLEHNIYEINNIYK